MLADGSGGESISTSGGDCDDVCGAKPRQAH